MRNNTPFSTATEKNESHSEAVDFTVDRSCLKEAREKEKKENKTIFLKNGMSNKLNPVSLLLILHLATTSINHL